MLKYAQKIKINYQKKKKKFIHIHSRNRYFLNFVYEFYFPIIDDLAVFGKTVYTYENTYSFI